jgi:hypothetical protein
VGQAKAVIRAAIASNRPVAGKPRSWSLRLIMRGSASDSV